MFVGIHRREPCARRATAECAPGRLRYLQPGELHLVMEFFPAWLRPIIALAAATIRTVFPPASTQTDCVTQMQEPSLVRNALHRELELKVICPKFTIVTQIFDSAD